MKKVLMMLAAAMLTFASTAVLAETPTDLVVEIVEAAEPETIVTPAEEIVDEVPETLETVETVETAEEVEETVEEVVEPTAEEVVEPTAEETASEETEEPITEENEEASDEPMTEETVSEIAETDQSLETERKITIHMQLHGDRLTAGATVTLSAVLIGYDDAVTTFQWQRLINGAWQNVGGATEQSYTFELTEDMNGSTWQVSVEVMET